MPVTAEKTIPTLVNPELDPVTGELRSLRASVYFVAQNWESWESKRDVIANRALIARAAEPLFGRKLLCIFKGVARPYRVMDTKRALDRRAKNPEVTHKSSAILEAFVAVDELTAAEVEETKALARYINVRKKAPKNSNIVQLDPDRTFAGEGEMVKAIKDLVWDYATNVDADHPEELKAKAQVLCDDIKAKNLRKFAGGGLVASDLEEVCEQARAVYQEHGQRLLNVDFNLSVYAGLADGGLQTKSKRDLVNRLVEKSESNPLLNVLLHPVTLGAVATLVAAAAKAEAKTLPLIGGLTAGIFASIRRVAKEQGAYVDAQRNYEIGNEVSAPAAPKGLKGKLVAGLFGMTDYSKYLRELASADDITQKLNEFVDLDIAAGPQIIKLVAEADARLDVLEEKEKPMFRIAEGGKGSLFVNRKKTDVAIAAAATRTKLREILGEEFEAMYESSYEEKKKQFEDEIEKKEWDFRWNLLEKAERSFFWGVAAGFTTAYGLHHLAKGVEVSAEKVIDFFHKVRVVQDMPLGDGTIALLTKAPTVSKGGMAIELPRGYQYGQVSHDGHFVMYGNQGSFDIEIPQNINQDSVSEALAKAGLVGKINEHIDGVVNVPIKSVHETILDENYLSAHRLVDITDKDWNLSFADGSSFTLHQDGPASWSIPAGVDDSYFGFFQRKDADGFHTLLAPVSDGRFSAPEEFVDPVTGKVDAVSVVGYAQLKSADGTILSSSEAFANQDLLNGATLESMASINVDQVDRMIGTGELHELITFRAEDLATPDVITTVPKDLDWEPSSLFNQGAVFAAVAAEPRISPDISKPLKLPIERTQSRTTQAGTQTRVFSEEEELEMQGVTGSLWDIVRQREQEEASLAEAQIQEEEEEKKSILQWLIDFDERYAKQRSEQESKGKARPVVFKTNPKRPLRGMSLATFKRKFPYLLAVPMTEKEAEEAVKEYDFRFAATPPFSIWNLFGRSKKADDEEEMSYVETG